MSFAGKKYGNLTVIGPGKTVRGCYSFICLCACGKTKEIKHASLRNGRSKSCGLCNYKESHPYAHKSWDSMHQRCFNSNAPDYPRYGGRGIKVCLEWLKFTQFLADMGDPPTDPLTGERYTLNRIDNNGDYTKDNCEWASVAAQNMNKSNTLSPWVKYYSNGNKRKV